MELAELKFAQCYPFSNSARDIIRQNAISLGEIPDSVIARARAMILAAAKQQKYLPDVGNVEDLLLDELLAFPIAKILLSLVAKPELYSRFANMFAKSAFDTLSKERDETLFDIAKELGIHANEVNSREVFAQIDMLKFLLVEFTEDFMKLVNQKLENGRISLDRNEFVRFLSRLIYRKIFLSFPVDVGGISNSFRAIAKQLSEQTIETSMRAFNERLSGSVNPNAFPPCISELYAQMLNGKNLNHNERFTLATFLVASGMSIEQIMAVFKNAPNFNERITRYQLERISGKGKGQANYSPASCAKMKSYKLCISNGELCNNIKHPMQYYRNRIFQKTRKPANNL